MKKILTASLVAMMAVTAANADIATTNYVDTRTGDVNFASGDIVKSATNLTEAVSALDTKLSTVAGTGDGSVEKQIGTAIEGLDSTQNGTGTVVKSVSQTDGKVSVTVGTIANADVADNAAIAQSKIAGLGEALNAKQDTNKMLTSGEVTADNKTSDELYVSAGAASKIVQDATGVFANQMSDTVSLAASALQPEDIESGTANGTISVNDTDIAVKGLGSAAYVETTAFDAAGSAATAKTEAVAAAKAETETQIAALSATVNAAQNNVITGIVEEAGKLKSVTSAQITNAYIADGAAIAKTKLANDVQTSLTAADTAMQLDDLKTAESYTTNGCATAGVICSLVSNGGTIAWEKVVNQ